MGRLHWRPGATLLPVGALEWRCLLGGGTSKEKQGRRRKSCEKALCSILLHQVDKLLCRPSVQPASCKIGWYIMPYHCDHLSLIRNNWWSLKYTQTHLDHPMGVQWTILHTNYLQGSSNRTPKQDGPGGASRHRAPIRVVTGHQELDLIATRSCKSRPSSQFQERLRGLTWDPLVVQMGWAKKG